MAEQNDQSRTEAPSPRRREQAREEGRVVHSPDLQTGLGLLAGAGLLAMGGEWLVTSLADTTTGYLVSLPRLDWSAVHTSELGWSLSSDLLRLCFPLVAVMSVVGLLAAVGQSGSVQLVPVKLDWSRLDPRSGWSRLFSWESAVRGLLALVKVTMIAAVALAVVVSSTSMLSTVGFDSFSTACQTAWDICGRLLLLMSGVTLGLGVIDFGFKWYRHELQLRVSRQELKEEQKDESGDPHLKAQLRRLQRQAATNKGLERAHEATVVITNPTHLSIALKYEHGITSAPLVLAKGEGFVALRIREIAAQHGITTLERKPLVRAMYPLVDIGQEIPFEFYQAIA